MTTRRIKLPPLEQRVTVVRTPDPDDGRVEFCLNFQFDAKRIGPARMKTFYDGLVMMLSALMTKAELKKFAATLERERAKLVAKA